MKQITSLCKCNEHKENHEFNEVYTVLKIHKTHTQKK